jgi:hypothetical protein
MFLWQCQHTNVSKDRAVTDLYKGSLVVRRGHGLPLSKRHAAAQEGARLLETSTTRIAVKIGLCTIAHSSEDHQRQYLTGYKKYGTSFANSDPRRVETRKKPKSSNANGFRTSLL